MVDNSFLLLQVGEEVERALARWAPSATPPRLAGRSSPKRIQGSNAETLRLQFRSKLALPLFTGSKVEGEGGSGVHVVLLDADTGLVKSHGLEANAKLEVVVLEGDFSIDEERDWTQVAPFAHSLHHVLFLAVAHSFRGGVGRAG